jgi:hypothetical protein
MIPNFTTRRLGSDFGTPPLTLSTTGTKPAAARLGPTGTCATTLPNPSRPSNDSGQPRSAVSSLTRTAAPAGCEVLRSFRQQARCDHSCTEIRLARSGPLCIARRIAQLIVRGARADVYRS